MYETSDENIYKRLAFFDEDYIMVHINKGSSKNLYIIRYTNMNKKGQITQKLVLHLHA